MPRKYPIRRKLAYRKKAVKPGMRRKAYGLGKVYAYKRFGKTLIVQNSATAGVITTNDATQVNLGSAISDTVGYQFGASMAFNLGNVQTFSDFTNLYDQYKISGVKLTIIPLSDSATAQSAGYLPTLYYARDNDDAVVPPTESSMRERQDCKAIRLTKPANIFIANPKVAIDVSGAGGSLPRFVNNGWINCEDTTVIHNGLKMWFKNVDLRSQTTTITAFRIEAVYYLKFKNPQ